MGSTTRYAALLRGINVGGRNKISMADLRSVFSDAGYGNVTTYIQSGNVAFEFDGARKSLESDIEALLPWLDWALAQAEAEHASPKAAE